MKQTSYRLQTSLTQTTHRFHTHKLYAGSHRTHTGYTQAPHRVTQLHTGLTRLVQTIDRFAKASHRLYTCFPLPASMHHTCPTQVSSTASHSFTQVWHRLTQVSHSSHTGLINLGDDLP